jgi:hypothetical protein
MRRMLSLVPITACVGIATLVFTWLAPATAKGEPYARGAGEIQYCDIGSGDDCNTQNNTCNAGEPWIPCSSSMTCVRACANANSNDACALFGSGCSDDGGLGLDCGMGKIGQCDPQCVCRNLPGSASAECDGETHSCADW